MDNKLLDILACPICKGELNYDKKNNELICEKDKLAFPVRDDIPNKALKAKNESAFIPEPVVTAVQMFSYGY